MYQYSLSYYKELFISRLKRAESQISPVLSDRLAILISDITLSSFRNVGRGLFEKDKLLFAYLMAVNIARSANEVSLTHSINPSVCQSVNQSTRQSVSLSINQPSVCQSINPSVCQSVSIVLYRTTTVLYRSTTVLYRTATNFTHSRTTLNITLGDC